LFLARLAEEAGRYDDVVSQIKSMTYAYEARLTLEERNMLSVAYKNITNDLRRSWRMIDSLEILESSGEKSRSLVLIRQEKTRIERDLANICKDVAEILNDRLLPYAKRGEDTVFYAKMQGDYFRYLVEFALKNERDHYAKLSLSAYKFAYKHASSELGPTHPTRLGLALNFAVYYHDVLRSPERACHLAKHAFDEAVQCLDEDDCSPGRQHIQDALMILQLLRDDLVLWFGEMQDEPGANTFKN
jgi:14-3-3 protein epsilon